mmetsp:Transcript_17190/g.51395  ORF Transcript_17190/g.51395 Transcript_17190/m.51395 type:complete len:256 (-) Transcript_17190:631-1398(-)
MHASCCLRMESVCSQSFFASSSSSPSDGAAKLDITALDSDRFTCSTCMRSEELLPVPEANELSSTVSCPVVGTAGSRCMEARRRRGRGAGDALCSACAAASAPGRPPASPSRWPPFAEVDSSPREKLTERAGTPLPARARLALPLWALAKDSPRLRSPDRALWNDAATEGSLSSGTPAKALLVSAGRGSAAPPSPFSLGALSEAVGLTGPDSPAAAAAAARAAAASDPPRREPPSLVVTSSSDSDSEGQITTVAP